MTNQDKRVKAQVDEAKAKGENAPASDIYSEVECKDPETGVEVPTDDAVEEAKDWVDNENQR